MWNYRLIKHKDDTVGLYEVIYNDDKQISAHDQHPTLIGDNADDILDTIKLMLNDVIKCKDDILHIDKIKFAPLVDPDDEFVEVDVDEFLDKLRRDGIDGM